MPKGMRHTGQMVNGTGAFAGTDAPTHTPTTPTRKCCANQRRGGLSRYVFKGKGRNTTRITQPHLWIYLKLNNTSFNSNYKLKLQLENSCTSR